MCEDREVKVQVRSHPLGRGVYACADINAGEVVLTGWGPRVPRSRYSFQVGPDEHVEITSEIELVNHSCDPNCGVLLPLRAEQLAIVAMRQIRSGEELTTDYAMHDYEIAFMPAACLCGSPLCRGRITGYQNLPEDRRRAYGRFVAEYLPALDSARRLAPAAIDPEAPTRALPGRTVEVSHLRWKS